MKISILSAIITASGALILPQQVTAASPWEGKPLSAVQVEYDEAMPNEQSKSRVYVSQAGLRIEIMDNFNSTKPNIISLYRFKTDKNLLISPKRKTYTVIEEMKNLSIDDDLGSVLSHKPCEGFAKSKNTGQVNLQKRNVEKWACLHPTGGFVVFQYYDPSIKLVLKENADGQVIELRDIKLQKQKKSLFAIPKGYKKISMTEMIKEHANLQGFMFNQ